MEKKASKPVSVKIVVAKPLETKLKAAVQKVLKENKAQLTDKIQKTVNKFIKKIVKKTDKQIKKALKTK